MKFFPIKDIFSIVPRDSSLLRGRILFYTVFELITRKYFLYFLDDQGSLTKFPTSLSNKYAQAFPRLWAYLNIIAYDDPVESLNLSKEQIYNQLIRCALGFYMGRLRKRSLNNHEFEFIVRKLKNDVQNVFDNSYEQTEMLTNIDLVISTFLGETTLNHDCFRISDFLFKFNSSSMFLGLNYSILASYGFGWELGKLESVIEKCIFLDNNDLQWTKNYISKAFIKAGYSQANTPLQKEIENISWKSYVKIACGKSNYFLDLANCSRSLSNKSLFYRSRLGRGRFCEQFYLDDIQDFRKDNSQGILNFFVMVKGCLKCETCPF